MDSLHQLRECIKNKEAVVYDAANRPNEIFFNGTYHQRDAPTHIKSKKGKGPAYSLGTIWFFWTTFIENNEKGDKTVDHGAYMRECKKIGVPHVSLLDKQELNAWFKGSDTATTETELFDSDVSAPQQKKQKTGNDENDNGGMIVETSTSSTNIDSQLTDNLVSGDNKNTESQKPSGTTESTTSTTAPVELTELTKETGLTKDQIDLMKKKLRERKKIGHHHNNIGDNVDDMADAFFEAKDDQIVKDILQRERLLCGPQTILQAPTQKSFSNCLKVVHGLMQKEEKEKILLKKSKQPQPSHNRYEKVNEDEYWKERDVAVENFQLDTRGSFEGFDLAKIATAVVQQQTKKEPQNTSLQHNKYSQQQQPQQQQPQQQKSSNTSSSSSSNTSQRGSSGNSQVKQELSQLQARKRTHNEMDARVIEKPIIIVPGKSTTTSLLNLNNAKQFLLDYKFIPPQDIKETTKQTKVEFEYTSASGQTIKMLIVDNVNDLRKKEWTSVVAVFAQGQEWQFKQYPKEWGGVTGIFSKTRGYHIHYDDEKVPKTVASWNVKPLSVSKTKRHLDGTAARKFWEEIDLELRKRNFIK